MISSVRSLRANEWIWNRGKCPKVSNTISRELIWQEVRSGKTLDLQGFYGMA
jgi:hypothetical protein